MNPVQTSEVAPKATAFTGKVTRSIKNPFTGESITAEGNYSLPLANSDEDALKFVGGKLEDVLFWFNYGRKVAARTLVNNRLGFDLGSEKLNDDFKAFQSAMDNMVTDKTTPERRAKIKDFILSEEKFSELAEALKDFTPGTVDIDFATTELPKPSGVRGPRKKNDSSEANSEESE